MRESVANNLNPSAAVRARFSAASAYLAACVALGVQSPFFPLFLAERGFNPDAISFALALPMAIRLMAMPLAGIVSDRLGAPRAVLTVIGCLAAAGFTLVGTATGVLPILLAIGLAAVFWTPVFPLLDAYALRLASLRMVDYGRVRLWGSVSFVATNVAAGYLLNWTPLILVIWVIVGSLLFFALSVRALPAFARPAPHERRAKLKTPPRALLLGVVAAACVQASHALVYGFSSLDWHAKGISTGHIGILWGIGTTSEIALFYVGTRVTAKIPPLTLIAIGGLAALLRFGAFALDPPVILIAFLQLLHAFTFGATHLGLMTLLGLHITEHAAGRAQTYAQTVLGVVMALATLATGPLYTRYGDAGYAFYAVLGAIGGAIALIARAQPQSAASGGKRRALS